MAIYNEVIRNSTAVYSEEEFTAARGATWFDAKGSKAFPFIVARDSTGILGFGTFGEFRAWPCYRHTVEHSVHVRADCRGQGIGKMLLVRADGACQGHGKHVMIAGIDADNAVSIGLHQQSGFTERGPFSRGGLQVRALARLGFSCNVSFRRQLTPCGGKTAPKVGIAAQIGLTEAMRALLVSQS
jgi:L-amino acid N-acyltransferase YncA